MVLLIMIVLSISEVSKITASSEHDQGNPIAQPEADEDPLLPRVPLEDVLQFLHSETDVHLQMTDLEDYGISDCMCVKSMLHAKHLNGSERSLECYKYVKLPDAADTANLNNAQATTDEKTVKERMMKRDAPDTANVNDAPETPNLKLLKDMMIKEEGRVDFQTGDVNGVMTVQLKTIVELAPTENAPREFPHDYAVIQVASDCLLVSYGQTSQGCARSEICRVAGIAVRAMGLGRILVSKVSFCNIFRTR
ncbi:uncharacterized protein LOC142569016 isoform X2 [Dermacentor variabilis]|uniref:uncharacterized protein LOC142569016 isoform X2 n=1 Tax=Dermacentor variabilis TaxID=34621 RepID=UPI003F5C3CD8